MTSDYIKSLQIGLSPSEKLEQIVAHTMCIGCGLCEAIVGENKLAVCEIANGFERPMLNGKLSNEEINDILASCPGTRVEGLPNNLIDEASQSDLVWGIYQEMVMSYSAEPMVRHHASTGGVLTALALYLVEANEVDFVLHAKASRTNPSFGEATISHSREQIIAASGSRYGPTATLKNIDRVLDQAQKAKQSFAFIGTPCDVSALRNYARIEPRVNEHCKVMLTMVCGGFMSPMAMRTSIEAKGIEFEQVESIRYRGDGCPGPTAIHLKNGETHRFSYLEFWGEDESSWNLPPRCKICPDGIGDSADIAAADSWEGGAPTEEGGKSDLGQNAVILRTKIGADLFQRAIASGYLKSDSRITPDDMNRFQPHQEKKKRAAWARFKGMRKANHLFPHTENLRLRRLHNENDDELNITEEEGAYQRVKTGNFTEE